MHTISRRCIPLIYGPLGKRILPNIQTTLPFHYNYKLKSCPLVCFPVLILRKKYIRVYIFMTIQYLINLYLIPLNLRVSGVVRPHSFNISS